MNTLESLQKQFTKAIIDNNASDIGKLGILVSPPVSPQERLSIYQHAYWIRLVEALEEDFPLTLKLLGEEKFWKAAKDYLKEYPSRYAVLAEANKSFYEFMKRRSEVVEFAFLPELVRFEWTQVLAEMTPQPIKFNFMSFLATLSEEGLEDVHLKLSPSVQFFETPVPIPGVFTQTRVLIYQKQGDVYWEEIQNLDQWALLQEMAKQTTIGEMLSSFQNLSESHVFEWFCAWVREEVICGASKKE